MNRVLLIILSMIVVIVSVSIIIQKYDFDNLDQNAIAECNKFSHTENLDCEALVESEAQH
jgi:hypothetical protein